jgi:hypothetical protein
MARLHHSWSGRARQLCPGTSDVDFLGDFNGVVNLHAKVTDCALDLGVAEQQLDGPQVSGSPIDQRGLGSAQRVCAELEGIEANAAYPLTDQAGVLSRRQPAIDTPSASEQELAGAPPCNPKMRVDCLTGLLGEFEPHRASRLLLPDSCPMEGIAMWGNVIHTDGHHIATAQLAIDGEIEECQV